MTALRDVDSEVEERLDLERRLLMEEPMDRLSSSLDLGVRGEASPRRESRPPNEDCDSGETPASPPERSALSSLLVRLKRRCREDSLVPREGRLSLFPSWPRLPATGDLLWDVLSEERFPSTGDLLRDDDLERLLSVVDRRRGLGPVS